MLCATSVFLSAPILLPAAPAATLSASSRSQAVVEPTATSTPSSVASAASAAAVAADPSVPATDGDPIEEVPVVAQVAPVLDAETAPLAEAPAPPGLDPRCAGTVLCISKADRKLRWIVNGQVVTELDARFGSRRTPTRNGVFSVYFKSRNHVSTLFHTAMPYAMFFYGGQAVHYSSDFARRGYAGASHGCVNIRDRTAIATLFDTVPVGTKVVVY